MSVRENGKDKNCSNRGLGIAAAALGVGVGAALYYIFSKRTENPDESGATSNWSAEEHALPDSSYSTISEHSTSDTSINSTTSEDSPAERITRRLFIQSDTESEHSTSDISIYSSTSEDIPAERITRRLFYQSDSVSEHNTSINSSASEYIPAEPIARRLFIQSDTESDSDSYDSDEQNSVQQSFDDFMPVVESSFNEDAIPLSDDSIQSDDETNMEFDVTRSSVDVPTDQRSDEWSRTPMMMQFGELTVRLRNRVENRERSWTLEQCSICFDMMQKEQEVLSLVCTHRFHQACIVPWLEQQQTCPVCRKAV